MSKYVDIDALVSDIAKEQVYVFTKPELISGLKDYPTADVKEVVHGEWEWYEEWSFNGEVKKCDCAGFRCSVCKNEPSEYHFFDNPDYSPIFDFCPHCGADMRGERNDLWRSRK